MTIPLRNKGDSQPRFKWTHRESGREEKQQSLGEARASERAFGVLVGIGIMEGSFGVIESWILRTKGDRTQRDRKERREVSVVTLHPGNADISFIV